MKLLGLLSGIFTVFSSFVVSKPTQSNVSLTGLNNQTSVEGLSRKRQRRSSSTGLSDYREFRDAFSDDVQQDLEVRAGKLNIKEFQRALCLLDSKTNAKTETYFKLYVDVVHSKTEQLMAMAINNLFDQQDRKCNNWCGTKFRTEFYEQISQQIRDIHQEIVKRVARVANTPREVFDKDYQMGETAYMTYTIIYEIDLNEKVKKTKNCPVKDTLLGKCGGDIAAGNFNLNLGMLIHFSEHKFNNQNHKRTIGSDLLDSMKHYYRYIMIKSAVDDTMLPLTMPRNTDLTKYKEFTASPDCKEFDSRHGLLKVVDKHYKLKKGEMWAGIDDVKGNLEKLKTLMTNPWQIAAFKMKANSKFDNQENGFATIGGAKYDWDIDENVKLDGRDPIGLGHRLIYQELGFAHYMNIVNSNYALKGGEKWASIDNVKANLDLVKKLMKDPWQIVAFKMKSTYNFENNEKGFATISGAKYGWEIDQNLSRRTNVVTDYEHRIILGFE